MSPDSFKEKITNKTKAVIPVHFAGSSCDMNKISRIAKQNNIKEIRVVLKRTVQIFW